MGLTSAMYTGLSGLNTNQFGLDTIGNNIANANTTAYKESRASFEDQFALTLSGGTGPSATSGGTNPMQIGRGSGIGSVQRNVTAGSIEATGIPTNLAIEGQGYFVLKATNDQQAFTRDGTFKLDAHNDLVSADGFAVQGYGVDSDFAIIPGALTNLNIPVGSLSTARATTDAGFDGNLNANGTIATQGTILNSQMLDEGPGAAATEATLLTALYNHDPLNQANPLFVEGDVITVSGAKKGEGETPDAQFTVEATSTLGDFMTFLNNNLGINPDADAPGEPGIRMSTVVGEEGTIVIEGNAGEANALDIELSAIRSTNPNFANPFAFTEEQAANGESLYTTFTVYDSLGTPVQVAVTMTLEEKTNSGTTWRYYTESRGDTDPSPVLGPTGTVSFDTDGQMSAATNNTIQVNRTSTGAVDPLQVELDFSRVTALTTQNSTLVMTSQDGYGIGTLTNFSVGANGIITGTFSNGLNRQLGQVALASFTNPEGLVSTANNLFLIGANSGQPVITSPQTLGTGRVIGSSLELSNVDLTREFIGLITTSTGFSASGRVITTSNDLLNELLMIAR